ncbi:hypothetical protein C5167_044287 [Papaver somniferum]|uniref:Uncharacterized protein n=1 Tax=Papaver somniferum TaxID=3469 RepID=A0A4Y7LAN7_PAPSO|nr:hypothetical protein C5167_044287 [Papaver somniferum]
MMNVCVFGKFYSWLYAANMAYLDGKSNKMMDEVFLSYDHEDLNQHSFKLSENKSIASTSSELAVTFMIPRIEGDRGNDILTSKAEIEPTQSHPLVKQVKTKPRFISKDPKSRVTKVWIDDIERLVLEKLDKKGHEEEVVCLICLYMLVFLFFCRSSGDNLDVSYVFLVKNLETMDSVFFPDLIQEHLMESIKTIKRNNFHIRNYSGCTIYSLLWLAEHSNIDEISSDIIKVSSNGTPRAAKWDLATMKKAMLKKNITFLKVCFGVFFDGFGVNLCIVDLMFGSLSITDGYSPSLVMISAGKNNNSDDFSGEFL